MEDRVVRWEIRLPASQCNTTAKCHRFARRLEIDCCSSPRHHVAGARRPLRALLDTGATSSYVRAASLRDLPPPNLRVREGPSALAVKLADSVPRRILPRVVMISCEFDGFISSDEFGVTDMNLSFDCILGKPWLMRYHSDIGWLTRSVERSRGYDVFAVFAHLESTLMEWPHVAVVNSVSTAQMTQRASKDSHCVVCEHATHVSNAVE